MKQSSTGWNFRHWLTAILYLGASTLALAQRSPVATFTLDDGLRSATVFDLAQEPSGRLWIATRAGLSSFDGRTFTHHELDEGMRKGEIGAVNVDSGGHVWTVNQWGRPKVRRRQGSAWFQLPVPKAFREGTDDFTGSISSLAVLPEVAPGDGDVVAVGAGAGGLFLWDGAVWSKPSDVAVYALATAGRTIAVGTQNGFCRLRDGAMDCNAALPDARLAEPVLAFASSQAQRPRRLWILSPGYLGFLAEDRLTVVLDADEMPALEIRSGALTVDRAGGVYFGTGTSLYFFDPESRRVRTVGLADGLASTGVLALLSDRDANVWVGATRGLSRIAPRRFLSYGKADGLVEDEVSAIIEPSPGRYFSGHNIGFTFFDDEQTIAAVAWERTAAGTHPLDRIMDFASDRPTRVWAAYKRGVLEITNGGATRRRHLSGQSVLSIETDSRGRLWAAAGGNLFLHEGNRFRPAANVPNLRWLHAGPGHRLYGATRAGLAYRDDAWPEDRWEVATGPTAGSNNIYNVLAESPEQVWAGTITGLFELVDGHLVKVDRDGLRIDNPIYQLFRDRRGVYWFGTDDGVRVWDGSRLRRLSVEHGLAGRETNRGGALVDHRGRVWIGTDRGVSVYQEKYDVPTLVPVVELLSVESDGESHPLDAALWLGYQQRDLTFRYNAITHAGVGEVRVRYSLAGYDDAQTIEVPLSTNGIPYTHLPPGEYRLRLSAGWEGGPWSPELVSATITIARPLWLRPGLWAVAAGVVLLLAVGAHRQVRALRRAATLLRKVNQELQDSVVERDRALDDRDRLIDDLGRTNRELERFTYTVSHDLKSPLVTIKGFLGFLKGDTEAGNRERVLDDIARIESAAGKMGRLLDELLELSRIGRQKAPSQELSLTELAHEASDLTAGKIAAVAADLQIAPDLGTVTGDRTRLLELLQNLIENAAKYMGDQQQPRIQIDKRITAEEIVFLVRDNGSGVEPRYQELIFGLFERLDQSTDGTGVGLALARRIVEVHGGSIWVESEGLGKGSTFCFTLPAKT